MRNSSDLRQTTDEGPGEVATKSGPIGVILILVGGIALLAIIILGVLRVWR